MLVVRGPVPLDDDDVCCCTNKENNTKMMGALVLSFSNEKRDDGAIVSHGPSETPNYKRASAA